MNDLISKEKAYEVLSEYYHHKTEMQHKALREALDMVPPVELQPTCNKLATNLQPIATDCISRRSAIAYAISGRVRTLPTSEDGENWIRTEDVRQSLLTMPSVDIDLSDYSDRLWRKAYEQGKAVSKDALDEAYAHGYTAAEADFHKKNQWIPVTERLPKIDMSHPHHKDYLVQYDSGGMDVASWSNVNRFWTDHVTEPYWNCVQFAEVVAWMPLPEPWKGEDDAEVH